MSNIEQHRARLIAEGKHNAAARLVAPKARQQQIDFAQPTTDSGPVKSSTMWKVACFRTSCHNTTLRPKGERTRWACPDHAEDETRQLYYRGNIYEVISHNDEGVSFQLRNGKIITLELAKVEWMVKPKSL